MEEKRVEVSGAIKMLKKAPKPEAPYSLVLFTGDDGRKYRLDKEANTVEIDGQLFLMADLNVDPWPPKWPRLKDAPKPKPFRIRFKIAPLERLAITAAPREK